MTPLKQLALQTFTFLRYGGRIRGVPLHDRTVPTQIFNAAVQNSRLAVVFLPGFSSAPQLVPPGMLRDVAQKGQADFVRFTHPDLLKDSAQISYPRMIDDAVAVVNAMPHQKVVLAASSFGAGMMRFVADRINRETPGKVAGLVGWSAVTPEALADIFVKQAGWRDFSTGTSERLEVRVETINQPFFVSQAQVAGIKKLNMARTSPFDGLVTLICGKDDPIGKPEYSLQLAGQISTAEAAVTDHSNGTSKTEGNLAGVPDVRVEILAGGHAAHPDTVRRGLLSVGLALRLVTVRWP